MPRTAHVVAGLVGMLLLAACAPAQVRHSDLPQRCVAPDARALLQSARRSLVFQPYHPQKIYDVDGAGNAVPFQRGPLPNDALAVLSYPDPERFSGADADFARLAQRSFVYDDALAALWLTHDGDLDRARRVLASLAALQRPDGAWGFGFAAGPTDGFYNAAYVRTGAVAWVTYAFAHYQQVSHDARFAPTLQRATAWLLSQQDPLTGLFFAGSGRWLTAARFQAEWQARFFATEHQIDTWFALRAVARLGMQTTELTRRAQELQRGIYGKLWLSDEQRFAQGLQGAHVDRESALDASGTWSALWLLALGDRDRVLQALHWVSETHAASILGWPGWLPYRDAQPKTWFVEGSIALPLAYTRLSMAEASRAQWLTLLQLACMAGTPLVYAPDWHTDFPLTPAAAPTLWFLIAGQEIVEGGVPWLWAER